jgi:hypothetical protein
MWTRAILVLLIKAVNLDSLPALRLVEVCIFYSGVSIQVRSIVGIGLKIFLQEGKSMHLFTPRFWRVRADRLPRPAVRLRFDLKYANR